MATKKLSSIILIVPYFGKWPIWFDAFLISVAKNPTINWLCPTDCNIPEHYPDNILFIPTTLGDLNSKINAILNLKIQLSHKKFCDLKPAYAHIFESVIKQYNFWGFCDMDIIWGNIRQYMTEALLEKYDVISSLENMISGHFTIFKNNPESLKYYQYNGDYEALFQNQKHVRFDEVKFTAITNQLIEDKDLKVFWDKKELEKGIKSEVHQEYYLNRWLWKNGSIVNTKTEKKFMYLHFINWKKKIVKCEVKYTNEPETFLISFNGIHLKEHALLFLLLNQFKNLLFGYNAILKRKRLIKRIKKKLNIS